MRLITALAVVIVIVVLIGAGVLAHRATQAPPAAQAAPSRLFQAPMVSIARTMRPGLRTARRSRYWAIWTIVHHSLTLRIRRPLRIRSLGW